MRHPTLCALTTAVAALFLAAAVAAQEEGNGPQGTKKAEKPVSKKEQPARRERRTLVTDRGISDAIEQQLILDPGVSSFGIDVVVVDGVATLKGTTPDLLSKERAARVAETVRGVRGVVNRLGLKAPERSDEDIRKDVRDALFLDPVTESFELDVAVEDGRVTLGGVVNSWSERFFADRVARGVVGVTGIESNVEVDHTVNRTPDEIATEVRRRLWWDRYVHADDIEVAVEDGEVALSGRVASAAEKRRAHTKGYVAGVDRVDVSGLTVDPELARRGRRPIAAAKADDEIEAAVRDAILLDPRAAPYTIDVSVSRGRATLRGEVGDLRAKRAAAEDAKSVMGVFFVRNHLKVRPGTKAADDRIAATIRSALERDPYIDLYDIVVTSRQGVVTMGGAVERRFEKKRAENLAAAVPGVMEVKNKLRVEYDNDIVVFDPYVDEWGWESYEWFEAIPPHPLKSDLQIQRDIEDELFWSPFVDEDEVDVEVEDGVATLTGTVDDWREKRAARENALEGGATRVINRLEIGDGFDWPF